jgi:transposase
VDQAGWHGSKELVIPENVVVLPLPPYSPELNPIERIWLYFKESYLSHRLHDDYDAIVDAVCAAWNKLTAEGGRIKSPCSSPWIEEMIPATVKT